MEHYQALFEPDPEEGGYVITFPDFGYGATQGETDQEAMEMAQDLLPRRTVEERNTAPWRCRSSNRRKWNCIWRSSLQV
jgi:hypothetical protein